MLISIDKFYTEQFYNRCKEALKNNGIKFDEYISTVGSYKWYLDIPQKPIMVNYEICPASERRYLISKVKGLDFSDEYTYYRRADSIGHFVPKYCRNDAWSSLDKNEAYLFKVTSRKQLEDLTKAVPTSVIWYLGKYYGERYRLALTTSLAVRAFIPSENVLNEKKADETPEAFEMRVNYETLSNKEKIQKYSKTPCFKDGKFEIPLYYPVDVKNRFLII